MQNSRSTEGVASSNYEETWPLDHQQVQSANLAILKGIYTSHKHHSDLRNLRLTEFSTYEERIQCLDTASCELLLPILFQLRCNMEQVLAFERCRKDWSDNQTYESSLSLELSNTIDEVWDRINFVLVTSSASFQTGRPMVETELDNHIEQWQDLVGRDFVPGIPGYIPQGGNEKIYADQERVGRQTPELYTMGWVCALAKEEPEATAMLDEIHPSI